MVRKYSAGAVFILAAAFFLIAIGGCSKTESQPQMRGSGAPLPVEAIVIQPQHEISGRFLSGLLVIEFGDVCDPVQIIRSIRIN